MEFDIYCGLGDADFNLLEYLREITEAPEDVIRRHCKKLNISLWKKPPTTILNSLVYRLIPNTISSDSSDNDDDSINFGEYDSSFVRYCFIFSSLVTRMNYLLCF
jgi:hypothetical protein